MRVGIFRFYHGEPSPPSGPVRSLAGDPVDICTDDGRFACGPVRACLGSLPTGQAGRADLPSRTTGSGACVCACVRDVCVCVCAYEAAEWQVRATMEAMQDGSECKTSWAEQLSRMCRTSHFTLHLMIDLAARLSPHKSCHTRRLERAPRPGEHTRQHSKSGPL